MSSLTYNGRERPTNPLPDYPAAQKDESGIWI